MGLGLEKASSFEPIPAGTAVELILRIKSGGIGAEGLCTRSANGKSELFSVEYTVQGGDHNGRKVFGNYVLEGTSSGHAKAAEISRSLLRSIFEAVNGINPDDKSPETVAKLAGATLASFDGATFLAELDIEAGSTKSDGSRFRDKNVIGKVLKLGDEGYRRLDQQPANLPVPSAVPQGNGPVVVGTELARPNWAN